MTKSDFVRTLPGAPAREVVAKAKQHGISLTEKLVYAIRSDDRARDEKSSRRGAEKSGRAAARAKGPVDAARTSAEKLLIAVAAKVGLSRAIELLEAEDRLVAAALAAR